MTKMMNRITIYLFAIMIGLVILPMNVAANSTPQNGTEKTEQQSSDLADASKADAGSLQDKEIQLPGKLPAEVDDIEREPMPTPDVTPEVTPTPDVEPTPMPEIKPTPDVTPTPMPEAKPTPNAKPKPTPMPEVKPTPAPSPVKKPSATPNVVVPAKKRPVMASSTVIVPFTRAPKITKTTPNHTNTVKQAALVAGNARMQMLDDATLYGKTAQTPIVDTPVAQATTGVRQEKQVVDASGIGRTFKRFTELPMVDRLSVYALALTIIALVIFAGYVWKAKNKETLAFERPM